MLPVFEGNRVGMPGRICPTLKDVTARRHHLFPRAASSWLGVIVTLSVFVTLILLFQVCWTLLGLTFSLILALGYSQNFLQSVKSLICLL